MIRLMFISDGERDHAMLPHLVGRVLGVNVEPRTERWARQHQRGAARGYERKLQFAIRQARDAGVAGLIATVDRDRSPAREKLRELIAGRERDRQSSPPFPAALGEAAPHGEAWLIDDPVAVREALGLAASHEIPNVARIDSPKDALDHLLAACDRDEPLLELLGEIAQLLDLGRCNHRDHTGLAGFLDEVRSERRPLVARCPPDCPCGDACPE